MFSKKKKKQKTKLFIDMNQHLKLTYKLNKSMIFQYKSPKIDRLHSTATFLTWAFYRKKLTNFIDSYID